MFFFSNENENLTFKPRSVEHGYLVLLKDDLLSAGAIFESIDSPRALWAKSLIGILNGYIERQPTYFEIRNFLEIDLDFLIKNDKIDYAEMLLGAISFLASINQEAFKYVARVMLENKFYKAAFEYLNKSKDVFYNDPELHFLFAKYYIIHKEYEEADFYLDECLNILPDYFPAHKLQKEISIYLA